MNFLSHLECSECGTTYPKGQIYNLCAKCGSPLLVRYDLAAARTWSQDSLKTAPSTMWRYAPVLPVQKAPDIVSLGEGMTPLLNAGAADMPRLLIKDEGLNPTGSFKARGLSCAVSMCKELGITKVAIPSAGNAAGAMAAYAAAAGMEAHIFMPRDVPQANYIECKAAGAHVTLVDGLISDCARIVGERKDKEGWFDVSTLKEPYRIEGKKTMGYELAEQLDWTLPDALLYPAGGGVGLIGMWKAFDEMEAMGWIGSKRPKMIAVQSEGCAPVVRAWQTGADDVEFWQGASTVAAGLRVPKPLGGKLMIRAMRATGGTAIAVSDREALDGGIEMAHHGVFAAPEGGACLPAVRKLVSEGFLKSDDQIVLYNTGTGLKYLEAYATRYARNIESDTDKLGGLITPR